ncbi:MAG TPA: FG-GAP-like repeat-containing protein [Terriglobales bacterium]|nr:FG-GAP-like repeat-containing protein [Terriglobales bacterium]
MRRVFVVVVLLLAAGMVVGARASQHKPAQQYQAPSLKALRQTPRAQRGQLLAARQRGLRSQAQQRSTAVRSTMKTGSNPPGNGVELVAATSLWPNAALPKDVAAGDFNGDGIADLVFNGQDQDNGYADKLWVMLGKGGGAFDAATALAYPVPWIAGMFAADMNGDTSDDLILVDGNAYAVVHVYLSDGHGGFAPNVATNAFPAGVDTCNSTEGCEAVAILDRNGDGKNDIVIVRGNQFSELLNAGEGTFGAATVSALPLSSPRIVALGDLNGDGRLDVVGEANNEFTYENKMQVVLGNATGFEATGHEYPKPMAAWESARYSVADVNGDGKMDVVSLDSDALGVSVFYQNSDGTFTCKGPYFAGDWPSTMNVGDVNGDGKAEVVVLDYEFGVAVVLGGGEPLTIQGAYGIGGWPQNPPLIADLTGDGKLDIAAGNATWDVSFLRNVGDGTFAAARFFFPTPSGAWFDEENVQMVWSVAAGDLNGDGYKDVVAGIDGDSNNGIAVYLANADGTLQPGINIGSGGEMYNVVLADLDRDGSLDIVAANQNDHTVGVFFGDGQGSFHEPVVYVSAAAHDNDDPWGLVAADFNTDGAIDIAVRNYDVVAVLVNDGSGRLLDPRNYDLRDSRWDGRVRAADVNNDGKLDLVSQGYYEIEILLGKGDGTFNPAQTVAWSAYEDYYFADYWDWSFSGDLAIADLNKDGKMDLLATTTDVYCYYCYTHNGSADTSGRSGVLVSLGNGDGTFAQPVLHSTTMHDELRWTTWSNAIAVADMNGDGNLDVVVPNDTYGNIALLFGDGTGNFYDPQEYLSSLFVNGLVVTDMNGDNAPDVLVAGFTDWHYVGAVGIMENSGGAALTIESSENPARTGALVALSLSVKPSARGVSGVPTGSVSVYDGTAKIAEGTLENGAAGFLLTDPLTAGVHQITASYAGDANFLPTSAMLVQFANGPNDYDLTADKTSATIKAGQSAMFTLTITPKNGFVGTVSFSCGTLPSGVSCGFNPSSVTPNGKDPVQVTLTVHTTATSTAALRPNSTPLPLWATLWGVGVMGIVMVGGSRRRNACPEPNRNAALLVSLVVLAILLAGLVGCGSTKTVTQTVTKEVQALTPAGQHSMTVNAITVGGTPKPLSLTVTVQ